MLTVRVELLQIHASEKRPGAFSSDGLEPCVDIAIDEGGRIMSNGPHVATIGINRFRLFKCSQVDIDSVFSFGGSGENFRYVGVYVDHINQHQKSARLIFLSVIAE